MTTLFAVSEDGARIAYDMTGIGPALVLLHGAGQTRRAWHDAGYVTRLRDQFRVITMDIRGHGESDKPIRVESYAIDRLIHDVLSVVDAAQVTEFSLWGYSYGGNIGRYLPAGANRMSRLVIMGISFGTAAPAPFRQYAVSLRAKWAPVIEANESGTLDLGTLSEQDRALWHTGTIPLTIAQLSAILDWPPVEPADLSCPTLWVVGSANEQAMPSAREHQSRLAGTHVTLEVLQGLTHADELSKIDEVLPPMLKFTLGATERPGT